MLTSIDIYDDRMILTTKSDETIEIMYYMISYKDKQKVFPAFMDAINKKKEEYDI